MNIYNTENNSSWNFSEPVLLCVYLCRVRPRQTDMSWAEEDWTVGLSGRVLQKVKELQIHKERLSRENKQKQLQLDNIHTSLEKQTVKVYTTRLSY